MHAAEELKHALIISNQIDYLGGMPTVTPKPVKTSEDAREMLRFDLENEPDEQELPAFILFHAYYNTATRLTNIGAYAVDRKSGALWEPVACELLHSDALIQLQDQYRDHIGLTANDWRRRIVVAGYFAVPHRWRWPAAAAAAGAAAVVRLGRSPEGSR